MQHSTIPELQEMRSLTLQTSQEIQRLVADGWEVHVVFDFDHVLCDGRSDDVFEALGCDVFKYFGYEERLLTQIPYDGPWAGLARNCGKLGFHQSQDIVTARTTYTAFRALMFCIVKKITLRWHISVGTQSKAESYRIALEPFRDKPKSFVFMMDDGERHVKAFQKIAEEMDMSDRTRAILSPRIRLYTEEDLKRHYEAAMDPSKRDTFHIHEGTLPGQAGPRFTFQVTPGGREAFGELVMGMLDAARREAIVNSCRGELEAIAAKDFPGRTMSTEELYEIWRLLMPTA